MQCCDCSKSDKIYEPPWRSLQGCRGVSWRLFLSSGSYFLLSKHRISQKNFGQQSLQILSLKLNCLMLCVMEPSGCPNSIYCKPLQVEIVNSCDPFSDFTLYFCSAFSMWPCMEAIKLYSSPITKQIRICVYENDTTRSAWILKDTETYFCNPNFWRVFQV